MSILIENKLGWLINHQTFVDNLYERCFERNSVVHLKFRSTYFEINTPMLMNSAALKRSERYKQVESKKKNRKKKKEDSGVPHLQVESLVENVTNLLCAEGRDRGYLKDAEVLPTEWFENNSAARSAAKELNQSYVCQNFNDFVNKCEHYTNEKDYATIITIGKNKYVMPPHSLCYAADVKNILSLIGTTYDVVLLDPPWKNKSVKRRKRYMTLANDDLLCIPIRQLTKPGSLVIVWATNNNSQINFVREQLFRSWNVEYCATWHWAKITSKGTFVHPIDSHQKKPYENIILGKVHCEESIAQNNFCSFEPNKVIVSIPSSIHSHKPPLSEILKSYMPNDAKCLELFARYLQPGWTSYGNEVLKLQNLHLFEHVE